MAHMWRLGLPISVGSTLFGMAGYEPRLDDIVFTLTQVASLDEVAKLDGHRERSG